MIEFVKYINPKTAMLQNLVATLGTFNVKGDAISGEPTLDTCRWFCDSVVKDLIEKSKNKYKYHNPIEVCWNDNQVYIEMRGIATGDITKVCAFKKLTHD